MVPPQSSNPIGERQPSHQGSRHEARLPAMVSSSDAPSAYDPYASARSNTLPLPPNVAPNRGGGQVSSNIGSFQSIDQTLLADYMRQTQEMSRVINMFQQDLRTQSQHISQTQTTAVVPPSTWVPTPTSSYHHPPTHYPRAPSIQPDLIDFSPSVGHPCMPGHLSTGSSQHIGYPFSPPPGSGHYAVPSSNYPPLGRPDTSGFPGSQSSILRNDSITTASEGRTEAHTDDRIDLSNFLHPGIRDSPIPDLHGSASTSIPSLTTPVVSEADVDYYPDDGPTLADAIDALTLSDQDLLTAPVTQAWVAAPDDSLSSFSPSLVATHVSGITIPQITRKITRAPLHPSDRGSFTRNSFPTPIPIRVYFLSRQFRRRKGIVGAILRWRIRLEEAYHGAFAEYGISVGPGHYVFEDMGNPLCFVGQQGTREGIFFTFPLRHSPAWISQNVADGGDATQSLMSC
jgi:hypothetical protein